MSIHKLIKFEDRTELALELSSQIAEILKDGIAKNGAATLAVSGGSTPVLLFEKLSTEELDWQKVSITLVDERWVDENNKRSNARLVKEHLLKNNAENAQFLPLFFPDTDIENALPAITTIIANLQLPFDAIVLGMGTDGHTASFFPGGKNLELAVDPTSPDLVSTIYSDAAGEPRITLNLPLLVSSKFMALHIEGKAKMDVLKMAQKEGDPNEMPVRHVLTHASHLKTFWCP